jgi:hypothetical protein
MNKIMLSAAAKKHITEDWKRSLPNLGIYKPLWLLKRNGPLLMGVILDRTRSNDVYIPIFHVHNLLWPSPFLVLSLALRVPNERQPRLERQIRVDRHDSEFASAVGILKGLIPEIAGSDISISKILRLHEEFLQQKRDFALARHCVGVFTDVILLSFWAGYADCAQRCLNDATELMQSWNAPAINVPSWRSAVEAQLDRSRMEATLAEEIKKLKLGHLPAYELLPDALPEPNIVQVYKAAWAK